MKILILTQRVPYPPFRGDKIKIFNIATRLLKNNYVKILCFESNAKDGKDLKEFADLGYKVGSVKLPVIQSVFNLFLNIFSKLPFQVAYYKSEKFKNLLIRELETNEYDVIYFHLIRSAQYLKYTAKSKAIKVFDTTDAISLYLGRYEAASKNPLKKLAIRIEKNRIKRYETISREFHTQFICSEFDRDYLLKNKISENVKLLINGINLGHLHPQKINYDKNRILFVGSMTFSANIDAVKYFIQDIFPLVLKEIPEAKFYIVGNNPTREILSLQSDKVIVTGFVKDICNEFLMAAVNIAPTRFGAGTLNKILEALYLGVPCVTSTFATDGLPGITKELVFVADNPEGYAKHIINIMKNPSIREKLEDMPKDEVKRLLDWDVIVEEFESYLAEQVKLKK